VDAGECGYKDGGYACDFGTKRRGQNLLGIEYYLNSRWDGGEQDFILGVSSGAD
jgi:hypothetical protein